MAANDTNYYLLLDISLDPPVKDKARLEAAIQKKLSEWNQGVNNPTHGLLFKSNAAKVPDIKKALVLGSESERDAVIAEAMTIAKGRVASLLEAIAKSGFITEAQIKEVCKKSPQFSEKTIRKMIKVPIKDCAGPSFVIPKKPPEPSVKPTDTMLMDKFEKNLQVIKKKDVYDFLGCTRVSPPATMCRIAGELLAKAGKATIALKSGVKGLKVWALKSDGSRLREVPAKYADGAYVFTASIDKTAEPTMMYELAK